MRRLHDAVVVGIGTVLADDPLLLPAPAVRRPFIRVVLDSRLRLPTASRLAQTAPRSPVWVLCTGGESRRRPLEQRGVTVIRGPGDSRVPLRWALGALWKRGIRSVMVEGGSEVLGAFLAERLVDQVALFRAPLLLGGRRSLPAFGGPDPARLEEALRLSPVSPLVRGRGGAPRAAAHPVFELWYPMAK